MTKSFLFSLPSIRSPRATRSRKGVTAVEMALIAPAFFLLLMGTIEIALVETAQQLIENAAFNASRLAKTGYTTAGLTQTQSVTQLMNNELQSYGNLINTAAVTMTSTAYNSFTATAGAGTAGLGATQQIVVYTISYPWKIFTPMLDDIVGDVHGNLNLRSQIVVRNEPF
jgi:Flp pilus assembly protein TadG